MSSGRKQKYEPRLQVVLESLAGERTPSQIAQAHGVHPDSVSRWTQSFLERGAEVFELDATFRLLIENAFDIVMIAAPDGKLRYVSPSVERTLGYTPDELGGTLAFALIHSDDQARARVEFAKVVTTGERIEGEFIARHKDGSRRICESVMTNFSEHPFIGGIVLNLHDVSHKRLAEEHLRSLEERYQLAFQFSPDSITINRLSDAVLLDINEGFERMTGYTRSEAIGMPTTTLGVWKDDGERERLSGILLDRGHVRDWQMETVTKDGRVLVCLLSADLVELDNVPCMLAVTRDITERERAIEEMRRTITRLRHEQVELREKNVALKQILDHLDEEKAEFRNELNEHVRALTRPMIGKLKRSNVATRQELALLEDRMKSILSDDLDQYRENVAKLTPRQLDICELIKKGHSSQEIAEELNVALQTVHKHRQLIRRKLQLSNQPVNLASYLKSK